MAAWEVAFLASNRLKLAIKGRDYPFWGWISRLFSRYPGHMMRLTSLGYRLSLLLFVLGGLPLTEHLMGGAEGSGWGWIVLLLGGVLLLVVEFLVRPLVRRSPTAAYLALSPLALLLYFLLTPLTWVVSRLSELIQRLLGIPYQKIQGSRGFDRVELAHWLDEVTEADPLQEPQQGVRLVQNALDFSQVLARDCMVPRIDIEAVEVASSIEALTARFVDTRFSRLPIYEGSIDRIIGYVNTKSLFAAPATLREILQEVEYVPESMPAHQVLTAFIKHRRSVVIVIDEFGGTAGLVTIEDILEEIFGEIEDEYDAPELVEKRVGENEYIFSGRVRVADINERYGIGIPESSDYDTLAGYLLEINGSIPRPGEEFEVDGWRLKVMRANASKLELLRLTRL